MGLMAHVGGEMATTELCKTAAKGNADHVVALVQGHGLDVNKGDYDDRTALHLSASEGQIEVVQKLVETLEASVSPVDRWGGTPLDDATRHGHQHVVDYLNSKKAKKGMMSDQQSIHMMCNLAAHGDADGLRALSRKYKELDINLGDYDKRTAIHLAASEGHSRRQALGE